MTTIVTRTGKGSSLSWIEADANFTNLNTDKLEKSNNLSDLTNAVLARANIGLGNVDNTADANKPVSTAQQTAINAAVTTHVGLSDPHTQYLQESAAAASTGASLVGYTRGVTGTVSRTVESVLYETISVKDFGALCDGVTDDTVAVQAAIDYCATFAQWPALIVPGKTLLTASINIDRLVDTTTSEFRIIGQGAGAGFYVTTGITMFTSTLPVTTSPQSEHIAFEGIQFECNSSALFAYVVSEKFLRVRFSDCFFQAIKCYISTIYAQDFRFIGCKARGWAGAFFTSRGAFYIVSMACSYEFGEHGFYLGDPANTVGVVGCSFHNNLFENSSTFITAGIIMGMSVQGNYFEYNSTASLAFNYSLANSGVIVSGNFFTTAPANIGNDNFFEVAWGDTVAAQVGGNHCIGRLHDTSAFTTPTFDASNDYASVSLVRGDRAYTLAGNGFVQIASVVIPMGEAHRVRAWTASTGAGNVAVYQEYVVSRAIDGSTNVATVADVAAGGYGVIITTGVGVYSVQNKATMPNVYQPYISIDRL